MKLILLIIISCTNFLVFSQENIKFNHCQIKEFPYYKNITEILNNDTVLKKEYEYLQTISIDFITYLSDNIWVKGFVIKPKTEKKLPVLIFNRGGNGNTGLVDLPFVIDFLSVIASKGYIVIGSQYRGALGSAGNDEFGGKEVGDIINLINLIPKIENTDSTRIGMLGWSRGVIMNYLTVKKKKEIKTIISIAGPSDLINNNRSDMSNVYKTRIPNYLNDSINLLKERSIIYSIDSLSKTCSYLLIHGVKDESVNVYQTINLYEKLINSNFTTRLIIFENEKHKLLGVKKELMQAIIVWLNKYL